MSLQVYPLVLYFGCIFILHVFDTAEARDPPSDVNTESVRITKFPSQYNDNSFSSSSQPAIPSSFATGLNQQYIYPAFPASTSTASSSPTTIASSFLNPGETPNVFTQALLASPILQRYFNLRIPRLQAANLFFIVRNAALKALGSDTSATIANIMGQTIAGLEEFTIPLFFQLRGRSVEKLLISEGIEIVPSLAQSLVNSTEKAFESSILNSNKAIIEALNNGLINFIQSIGLRYVDKAYILSLLIYEEVYPKSLKSLN